MKKAAKNICNKYILIKKENNKPLNEVSIFISYIYVPSLPTRIKKTSV